MPTKESELTLILRRMVGMARARRGERQKWLLPNCLNLCLYVEPDETTHLLLHRALVYPSLSEWRTVLLQWPVAVPEPLPVPSGVRFDANSEKYGLTAKWMPPLNVHQIAMLGDHGDETPGD